MGLFCCAIFGRDQGRVWVYGYRSPQNIVTIALFHIFGSFFGPDGQCYIPVRVKFDRYSTPWIHSVMPNKALTGEGMWVQEPPNLKIWYILRFFSSFSVQMADDIY